MSARPRPRPGPGSLALLFTLHGSILPRVAPKILLVAGVACAAVALERRFPEALALDAGIGPFSLVGLALSIFLSFRNNACYDRWWEGRRQWGALLVEARGLARSLDALLPEAAHTALRTRTLARTAAFAHALRAYVRGEDPAAAAVPWIDGGSRAALAAAPNAVDAPLRLIAADLADLYRAGALTDVLYGLFEAKLQALAGVQAACERIKGLPLPFAYTLLIYRTSWLYCLLLPFGLATSLGWATPLVAAFVTYAFFGLDALGDELEDPFGRTPNDLPLDDLVAVVDAIARGGRAQA